ncbi:MAG TPA: DUF3488 and transglutaminase-like domain-containing protein [Geomonas sp.]|nr:DUF3488 and transglutaminase-like domain-containing protein [Geomonas sp.]
MVRIKGILTGLTVCIAVIGYLPLQPYLDPFPRWFFPAALLLAFYLDKRGSELPERLLTPLSIVLFLYLGAGFSLNSIMQVTADLLVVFLGIRLLGERSGRNYLQVFGLALFCLAASSLYNLSALFIVYLLLLMLLLAVSLVVLTFHSHDPAIALSRPEAKKVLAVSCLMPVASLPILLFLFVLLPRTQYPLWDFMNQSGPKVTGFSDTVRPGSAPAVNEAKGVVLRAICGQLPEERLYWRGIVLNGFQGNDWVRLPVEEERLPGVGKGAVVHQEIYPEPSRTPYLLALNIPRGLSGVRYGDSGDDVLTMQGRSEKRIKYEAESVLSDVLAVRGEIDRDFYLTLPARLSDRMRAEGRELSRPGLAVPEKLRLVERFFRNQRLSYATSGLPVGPDALDSFLFVKRRGHCELFASACATLLRLAGVPARLVGGYRGGTYNAMGGYYLVTEEMAHVWVEAYDPARGWVTVDPSAWSTGFARNQGVARQLRMYADALGFYWNKAVITYDLQKQIALFTAAGSKARNLRLPAGFWKPLAGGAAALGLLAALVALQAAGPKSREEKVLRRFLRVLYRRYPAAAGEGRGLFELAEEVGDPLVKEFAAIYGNAVYHDRRLLPAETVRLQEIIRTFRQHPS